MNTQEGGVGELAINNNALQIDITNSGAQAWHVQLVKNNINLEQGKNISYPSRLSQMLLEV